MGGTFTTINTTNLAGWQAIATNFFGTERFLFLDPDSNLKPMSFYRVRLP